VKEAGKYGKSVKALPQRALRKSRGRAEEDDSRTPPYKFEDGAPGEDTNP